MDEVTTPIKRDLFPLTLSSNPTHGFSINLVDRTLRYLRTATSIPISVQPDQRPLRADLATLSAHSRVQWRRQFEDVRWEMQIGGLT